MQSNEKKNGQRQKPIMKTNKEMQEANNHKKKYSASL